MAVSMKCVYCKEELVWYKPVYYLPTGPVHVRGCFFDWTEENQAEYIKLIEEDRVRA